MLGKGSPSKDSPLHPALPFAHVPEFLLTSISAVAPVGTFFLNGEIVYGALHWQFAIGNAAVSLKNRKKPLTGKIWRP